MPRLQLVDKHSRTILANVVYTAQPRMRPQMALKWNDGNGWGIVSRYGIGYSLVTVAIRSSVTWEGK